MAVVDGGMVGVSTGVVLHAVRHAVRGVRVVGGLDGVWRCSSNHSSSAVNWITSGQGLDAGGGFGDTGEAWVCCGGGGVVEGRRWCEGGTIVVACGSMDGGCVCERGTVWAQYNTDRAYLGLAGWAL